VTELRVGDRVSWATPQGRIRGRIVDRCTHPFEFAGRSISASALKPVFIVQSDASQVKAAHRAPALRKLTRPVH
jgi:hypothetical protein